MRALQSGLTAESLEENSSRLNCCAPIPPATAAPHAVISVIFEIWMRVVEHKDSQSWDDLANLDRLPDNLCLNFVEKHVRRHAPIGLKEIISVTGAATNQLWRTDIQWIAKPLKSHRLDPWKTPASFFGFSTTKANISWSQPAWSSKKRTKKACLNLPAQNYVLRKLVHGIGFSPLAWANTSSLDLMCRKRKKNQRKKSDRFKARLSLGTSCW